MKIIRASVFWTGETGIQNAESQKLGNSKIKRHQVRMCIYVLLAVMILDNFITFTNCRYFVVRAKNFVLVIQWL